MTLHTHLEPSFCRYHSTALPASCTSTATDATSVNMTRDRPTREHAFLSALILAGHPPRRKPGDSPPKDFTSMTLGGPIVHLRDSRVSSNPFEGIELSAGNLSSCY